MIQQAEIFEQVEKISGRTPAVVEADDVLNHPETMLPQLCDAVGVTFTPKMLSWPAGPRPSDGVWAKHWYASVNSSTGFLPRVPRDVTLTPELEAIADACLPHYQRLHDLRLRA